jgi:hypothetical protein
MKATSLCAAALLVASTVCGYAAERTVGDTGGVKGASQFAPGHLPKGPHGASQNAPGHKPTTTGRGASEYTPGDKMNDARGK